VRFRCWLGRHDWHDLDTVPGGTSFADLNAKRRAARGEPLLRECGRCGRVESAAFSGNFTRAEHLERAC
jgi:hypothetical protein